MNENGGWRTGGLKWMVDESRTPENEKKKIVKEQNGLHMFEVHTSILSVDTQ